MRDGVPGAVVLAARNLARNGLQSRRIFPETQDFMLDPTSADPNYRVCSRCIMDTVADRAITFNAAGECNHCQRYDELIEARTLKGEAARSALAALTARIKSAGPGREYDCLIGVSGGVDSTYVAFLVKKLGLRPLAVHFDNGWNSELAVGNIEKVLKKLGIDLYTYVVDWEEFRDLQLAFLKASTPDGEIPTDHAIFALLWKEAARRGIKFVISGMNFATESVSVPDWSYGHSDWRYVKAIHRRFGARPLRTYPHFSFFDLGWINLVRGVRTVSILNYAEYDKDAAMKILQEDLGWVYYGGKHYESVYTRFWQGYVLPRKFGVDKRFGHLSDLVRSGQLSRARALEDIKAPPYPPDLQEQDLEYVIKKLGLTAAQFEQFMALPPRSFRDYPNSFNTVARLKRVVNSLRARGWYAR
jgi:N-acetyl sugar amidotransferase